MLHFAVGVVSSELQSCSPRHRRKLHTGLLHPQGVLEPQSCFYHQLLLQYFSEDLNFSFPCAPYK